MSNNKITVFLPNNFAWAEMNKDDYQFWTRRENFPYILKQHFHNTGQAFLVIFDVQTI